MKFRDLDLQDQRKRNSLSFKRSEGTEREDGGEEGRRVESVQASRANPPEARSFCRRARLDGNHGVYPITWVDCRRYMKRYIILRGDSQKQDNEIYTSVGLRGANKAETQQPRQTQRDPSSFIGR